MHRLLQSIFVLITVLFLFSCKNKEEAKAMPNNAGGTYFSIKDFTKDQWSTFHGQPFVLHQYITLNGKTDSAIVSALTMKWSLIFKTFFETDISDPKFLEQYDFSMFEESTTDTRTFTYIAKDPALFTQKLQIAADMYNNKIRNIFIETQKQTFWNTQTQKLFYSPLRVIQIQEHNDPLIGRQKDLVIEYKFM
ncbi:MAG: hypothetical protein V4561_14440 [Bacteroidota bacterium]